MQKNNRTITLSPEEQELYSRSVLHLKPNEKPDLEAVVNKTILGDTLEILKQLPESFADLIFLDPPYNLTKNYNGNIFRAQKSRDYLEYLRSWLPLACKKLKNGGSLYLCGDWRNTAELQTALGENLHIINRITWQRDKGRAASANWKNAMEDIWFAVKDPKNYYFDALAVKLKRKVLAPYREKGRAKDWQENEEGKFRLTSASNFWDDITVPFWSMPENTEHPTQKPEKLLAKIILASCPESGLVFDPFLGSGTSSVTAKKLGRNYTGIEQSGFYTALAEKRLSAAKKGDPIQGFDGLYFWERNSLYFQKKR